ncbi:Deoxyguanosinetriphosphate triphosphohydrolase-like protein [Acidobacteriia bacterium SbA2]|nr:Deoxyguanosinetriphosphate triphosphohydrolase-like protein [Acidobacteriia bacterium SbA2]
MGRYGDNRLASYAMRVEESQGRCYREPSHPFRNDYERDRDRILHSRAFRRLENKTQVFTRRYSDHFRTRLTHTLEVAQISRTAAKALQLNTDLVEALALAHDVGHPPFGHAGEAELNRLMGRYQENFDHNLHALRIVEHFEQKYVAFPGLNLTFEVREGIIKHSRDYDPAHYPELAEYALDARPPLEAQLIDPADEIAYNCADLDDGYEAKLLTLPLIRQNVRLFDSLYRRVDRKYPAAREKLKFNEALKGVLNILVTDLIESTRARLAKAGVKSVAGVRAHPKRLVGLGPRRARDDRELKEFLNANLYSNRRVGSERQVIVRCVRRLFGYYLDRPRRLPPFYVAQSRQEPLHRVVCDYIAGMTDNYLLLQYQKHLG